MRQQPLAGCRRRHRQDEPEGQTITRIQQKRERQRIHERNIGKVQLVAYGGSRIIIVAEGEPDTGRGKFADKSREPRHGEQRPGTFPAQQPGGRHQRHAQKEKDVGPEQESLPQQKRNVHERHRIRDSRGRFTTLLTESTGNHVTSENTPAFNSVIPACPLRTTRPIRHTHTPSIVIPAKPLHSSSPTFLSGDPGFSLFPLFL